MSKKPVIVFEGIECSGKSLHINNVCKFFLFRYLYLDNKPNIKKSNSTNDSYLYGTVNLTLYD